MQVPWSGWLPVSVSDHNYENLCADMTRSRHHDYSIVLAAKIPGRKDRRLLLVGLSSFRTQRTRSRPSRQSFASLASHHSWLGRVYACPVHSVLHCCSHSVNRKRHHNQSWLTQADTAVHADTRMLAAGTMAHCTQRQLGTHSICHLATKYAR